MKFKYLITLVLFCCSLNLFSQTNIQIDSLQRELTNATGARKTELFIQILKYYRKTDQNKARQFGMKALAKAEKQNNKPLKAIVLRELGAIHTQTGNYTKAIEYILQSLKIHEELKLNNEIAADYNVLASIHILIGQLQQGIDYCNRAIEINQQLKNENALSGNYNNLASAYLKENKYTKALNFFNKALSINKKLNNKDGIASNYNNMGYIYEEREQYEVAQRYYNSALGVKQELQDNFGIASIMTNLSSVNRKLNRIEQAIEYSHEALALASKLEARILVIENFQNLSLAYSEKNNYEKALEYFKLYAKAKDDLFDSEKNKQVIEIRTKYEIEKKEKKIKELDLKRKNLELQKQENRIVFLSVITFLILTIAVVFWYLYNSKNKTNKFLLEKNRIISNKTSELQITNEQLKRAIQKVQESDRLKSAFLANMSHEIRTPLNGIIGFTELLRDEELDNETRKDYIELINTSGELLLNLINDIIDISKIEAGQVNIENSNVSLNKMMNSLLSFYTKARINKNNLDIRFINPSDKENIKIRADELKLQQILNNLLSNALKFTEKGVIEFGYVIKHEDKKIEFFVSDTGIGIPEEKVKYIFQRFRQADGSTTRKYGGTGLGLAISKALVELMEGEIWIESSVGCGSTFYFTIPYRPVF